MTSWLRRMHLIPAARAADDKTGGMLLTTDLVNEKVLNKGMAE